MDDFSIPSLNESKNEWSIRLVNILTDHIIDGFKSIFNEAWNLCKSNDEIEKYLMTFQNLISNIPQWSDTLIEAEKDRIIEKSNCSYIEDLLTCVHIIQLKALTCVRVSSEQKKVDLDIPKLTFFIHKVYITIARKLYVNIYLFERNIPPLEIQKHNREFEVIVKECIMNTIRDNIPIDNILRAYIDETEEINVDEKEEIVSVKNLDENEKKEEEDKETQEEEKRKLEEERKQLEEDKKAQEEEKQKLEEDKKAQEEEKQKLEEDKKKDETIKFTKEELATSLTNEESSISFNPQTESMTLDGKLSHDDLKNEASPQLYDDDDDDDDEKLKIGEEVNLNGIIEDESNKESEDDPILNIEVLN